MDIKKQMESKWDEIAATKSTRAALFENFEDNKDRIAELHFEVEIKQLEYLILKRQQLAELKAVANFDIVTNSVTETEKINETCIEILRKDLLKNGYENRLEQGGLMLKKEVPC